MRKTYTVLLIVFVLLPQQLLVSQEFNNHNDRRRDRGTSDNDKIEKIKDLEERNLMLEKRVQVLEERLNMLEKQMHNDEYTRKDTPHKSHDNKISKFCITFDFAGRNDIDQLQTAMLQSKYEKFEYWPYGEKQGQKGLGEIFDEVFNGRHNKYSGLFTGVIGYFDSVGEAAIFISRLPKNVDYKIEAIEGECE